MLGLSLIIDLFDERQWCLLVMKARTNPSELQQEADKLDMTLLLLCERIPSIQLLLLSCIFSKQVAQNRCP